MHKVININFQGRILPIEEMAYEMLKQYIESLRNYFEKEEGRDEIINDIECRIAELCDAELKKGTVCITEEHINLIIASIGRPADFEAQDGFEQNNTSTNFKEANTYSGTEYKNWESTTQKRLYRDEQHKVFGGVCSGIANYFNLDPLIVRVLWVLFLGVNVLAYLILWIAVPSSSVKEVGGVKKRLFRSMDNKIIGGVCAGLSKYFGIRVGIIRLLFLLPFIRFIFNFRHFHLFQFWEYPDFPNFLDFTVSPGAVFVYIVLWLILPEAKTSADKLEMVGEKVDINSIKNTIQSDMEGFGKRAQSWGSDLYNKTKSTKTEDASNSQSSRPSTEEPTAEMARRTGCFYYLGRTITILFKAFVYFVLGIIVISLLAALFGIGVVTTGLLPLRRFILEDGIQNAYVWGALLLFIWVPVIGIVTAIIRKIAGIQKSNIWVRTSLWVLWGIGIISFVCTVGTVSGNFAKHNTPIEETISLNNAKVDFLEITAAPKMKYYEHRWFKLEPFSYYDEDTVYVRNLRIRIVQSKTDSFSVKIVKLSDGRTLTQANTLAQKINFSLTQQDSTLFLDKGIAITKQDKFRNQHVIMTIAVPIGKRIKITNKGWSQVNVRVNNRGVHSETINGLDMDNWDNNDWNSQFDDESFEYERGVEYKMTTTGLEKVARAGDEAESRAEENIDESADGIQQKLNDLKEERKRLEEDLERTRAEKLKEVEKIDRALEKKADDKMNKKSAKNPSAAVGGAVQVASKLGELQWVLQRFSY